MKFKVNMFFHLYETPFTPFGLPTLIGWVRGGCNGKKNKFTLEWISGKIKCFKTTFFFLNGKPGHRGPNQPVYGKFH